MRRGGYRRSRGDRGISIDTVETAMVEVTEKETECDGYNNCDGKDGYYDENGAESRSHLVIEALRLESSSCLRGIGEVFALTTYIDVGNWCS